MQTNTTTTDGRPVQNFILKNESGMEVEISSYGGIIKRLLVPDRNGNSDDVVLGYNSIGEYEKDSAYFGALIGRYGNRIADGRFELNGTRYKLATNSSTNDIACHLHGGDKGFDQKVWDAESLTEGSSQGLKLKLFSPDGEEGYPGNLTVTVHYWLHPDNSLEIKYHAITDQATPVSLTNHTYFNLKGEGNGDVLAHQIQIHSEAFTPVTPGMIPTGEVLPLKNTPLDFNTPQAIGAQVDSDHPQLQFAGGYDHNYILDTKSGEPKLVATVSEATSGRIMEVWTDAPGVQFYCGNFLDGSSIGKSGSSYVKRGGFCLETQNYPDAPNHPHFPTTILEPGATYSTQTSYKFGNF